MSFIRYRVIISPPKSIDPYIINFYKTDRKYRFWKIRNIIYPAFFIQWISLTFIKTESTTGNSSNSIYKSVNTNKSMRLSFIIISDILLIVFLFEFIMNAFLLNTVCFCLTSFTIVVSDLLPPETKYS